MNITIITTKKILIILLLLSRFSVFAQEDEDIFYYSELNNFRRPHNRLSVSELYAAHLEFKASKIIFSFYLSGKDLLQSGFTDTNKDGFLTEEEFGNSLEKLKKWLPSQVYLEADSRKCLGQTVSINFHSFYFDEPIFKIETQNQCASTGKIKVHHILYSKLQFEMRIVRIRGQINFQRI